MNKPRLFGWLFFVTILVFGALMFVNASSFKGIDGIGSALYFSVVTITTLGFGDVAPKDGTGQLLACLEALIGVTLVGLFLNAISSRQAEKLHQNELLVLEKRRFMDMQGKLRQNYLLLKSLLVRYLEASYNITTPNSKRTLPDDIVHYEYSYTFNDMADLYEPSQSLTHQLNTPAIEIYFDMQHQLYDELRKTVSEIDLSYWPVIESAVHAYLTSCSNFTYENSIVENVQLIPKDRPELALKVVLPKLIKDHQGPLEVAESGLKAPYIALYNMLHVSVPAVQTIAKEMEKNVEQQA